MRVTNNMLMQNMLYGLNNNMSRMSKLYNRHSSGKKVRVPSDDPIVASRALKLRADVSEIQQFKKNTGDALSWMEITEDAVTDMREIMKRLKEVTVQAASDTLGDDDRQMIKAEISKLKEAFVEVGNASYAGRYVFAGYNTNEKPFKIEKTNIGEKITYNGKFMCLGGAVDNSVSQVDYQNFYDNNIHKICGHPEITMGEFKEYSSSIPPFFDMTYNDGSGDEIKTIKMPSNSYSDINTFISDLQTSLNSEFGVDKSKVKVQAQDGRVRITAVEGESIKIKTYDSNILPNTGFDSGARSSQMIAGNSDVNFTGIKSDPNNLDFNITFDGYTRRISLSNGVDYDIDTIKEELQRKLDRAFDGNIKVSSRGNKIEFSADEGNIKIESVTGAFDISKLGFNDGQESSPQIIAKSDYSIFTTGSEDLYFDLTIDGNKQTIVLDPNKTYDENTLKQAIENQIDTSKVKVYFDDHKLVFEGDAAKDIKINTYRFDMSSIGFADDIESKRDEKEDIVYETGIGNKININVEGKDMLGVGEGGIFETFLKLEMALDGKTKYKTYDENTGNVQEHKLSITGMLGDIEDNFKNILKINADIGARCKYVKLADNRLSDDYISFKDIMSKNEDADMAEVIMELKNQENLYRASLAAGARIVQPTLIDFIN